MEFISLVFVIMIFLLVGCLGLLTILNIRDIKKNKKYYNETRIKRINQGDLQDLLSRGKPKTSWMTKNGEMLELTEDDYIVVDPGNYKDRFPIIFETYPENSGE